MSYQHMISDLGLQPSSEQVLTDPYLLYAILTCISDAELLHGHLAGWARVCRGFHEPVVRILWRSLHCVFPLFHLLAPHDLRMPLYLGQVGCSHYLERVSHGVKLITIDSPGFFCRSSLHNCISIRNDGNAFSGMPLMSVTSPIHQAPQTR